MEASPLTKLPGELRNAIYALALHHPDGINVWLRRGGPERSPSKINTEFGISLLATCKQIRRECGTLYYSLNVFTLTLDPPDAFMKSVIWQSWWHDGITKWLHQIGDKNCSALHRVEFDMASWKLTQSRTVQPSYLWEGTSSLLRLFNKETRMFLKMSIKWSSFAGFDVAVCISLVDALEARKAINDVLTAEMLRKEEYLREYGPLYIHGIEFGLSRAADLLQELVGFIESANDAKEI